MAKKKSEILPGSAMDKELKQMVAKEIAQIAVEEGAQGSAIVGPDGRPLSEAPLHPDPLRPARMTSPLNLAEKISAKLRIPEGVSIEYQAAREFVFPMRGGEDVDFIFRATISAETPAAVMAGVDAALLAAREPFERDGVEVYLHAAQDFKDIKRVPGKGYAANLTHVFRVHPIEAGPDRR